ncbi:hypothetical protein CDD82_3716 [Ophiocordyceps australis]|uniref:ELYS-like domain-containing protein n=1 Tax=Ophiocordyceps australis TaxID=1399860 RepID=A0A2C5YY78_9HYPO|nr:hypothetical protein CDD82_3716 [Ophiocordyceps australis]
MIDYSDFGHVFGTSPSLSFDRKLVASIEEHRKKLDGTLFIDRIMKALCTSRVNKAYPPKSEALLRQLHQQLCEADMSESQKLSLLYYILLDLDVAGNSNPAAEHFATESGMPQSYQVFIKGLWLMDKETWTRALEYIAHPSLNPDFSDEIITVLAQHAPKGQETLALSYFYAVRPVLHSSLALELLFDSMTLASTVEALVFSRSQPQHTREQLFQRWLRFIVGGTTGHRSGTCGQELAFIPFDSTEEAWFEQYLSVGPGRGLKRAKDTLLMRKIAADRYAEVAKLRAVGPWTAVVEGIKHGIEGQTE